MNINNVYGIVVFCAAMAYSIMMIRWNLAAIKLNKSRNVIYEPDWFPPILCFVSGVLVLGIVVADCLGLLS